MLADKHSNMCMDWPVSKVYMPDFKFAVKSPSLP